MNAELLTPCNGGGPGGGGGWNDGQAAGGNVASPILCCQRAILPYPLGGGGQEPLPANILVRLRRFDRHSGWLELDGYTGTLEIAVLMSSAARPSIIRTLMSSAAQPDMT